MSATEEHGDPFVIRPCAHTLSVSRANGSRAHGVEFLCGGVGKKAVYCVQAERTATKDMAQLAQNMATLGGKREYMHTNICVGFLVDEHHSRP